MTAEMTESGLSFDPPAAIPGPSVGRIVHVRAEDGSCRAAMVVRRWGDPAHPKYDDPVNLTAFPDSTNDGPDLGQDTSNVTWWIAGSLHESIAPRDWPFAPWRWWHWPERV